MAKKTIKLNDEAKLVLETSMNELNDILMHAMVSYNTKEQFYLGYVVSFSTSDTCETGYFHWDNKYVYLCDACDNCYEVFNYIDKQMIDNFKSSQRIFKTRKKN